MDWPVRYKELITIGNFDSNVGVICHWTHKDLIARGLNKNTYAAIGQLYSRDLGVSSIIRNVLAHPHIDTLILCGSEGAIEETKSSKALLNLILHGVDHHHFINHFVLGSQLPKIEKEIPIDKINLFRSRVKIVNLIGEQDVLKIQKSIDDNFKSVPRRYETFIFPEPERRSNLELSSEGIGFLVRRGKAAECWIDILKNIMFFGRVKETQYGEKQKELVDLITVIEDEDLANVYLPDYFPLSAKQISEYITTVTTTRQIQGTKYTYGQRLRDHGGIDQIQDIAELISKTPHSRRALASTWNVAWDRSSDNPPCLNLVQALIQGNKLYLTVYIRSNDMFMAWPEDAFGILALRNLIIDEANKKNPSLNLESGSVVTISCSAHIYERNWEEAKRIVRENPKLQCAWDPRGNFIIEVSDNIINVYNTSDPINLRWQGKTAQELLDLMIFYVSQTPHAAYLGNELIKAEFALKHNLEYTQDRQITLPHQEVL